MLLLESLTSLLDFDPLVELAVRDAVSVGRNSDFGLLECFLARFLILVCVDSNRSVHTFTVVDLVQNIAENQVEPSVHTLIHDLHELGMRQLLALRDVWVIYLDVFTDKQAPGVVL